MRRIFGIGIVIVATGCGSGTEVTVADMLVTLGALPAGVAGNADSAYIRVRSDALNVTEVSRLGLAATTSATFSVALGTDYQVEVVTLANGTPNIAFGGGMVAGVTVGEGGASTTVPIEWWTATVLELADTVITDAVTTVRVLLSSLNMREATDFAPVGINSFLTPAPTADDYFAGEVASRFFSTFPADTILWNITIPTTSVPTELWLHARWSNASGGWGVGFAFDIAVPTLAAGDTLWWRPVVLPTPN